MPPAAFLELTEYKACQVEHDVFPYELGEVLLSRFSHVIDLEYPTPKTQNQWKLTPQGWVGYVPLSPTFGLRLNPKVPISNLFRMLEIAHGFKRFRFLDGMIEASTLEDYYSQLAALLAARVWERSKRGLYCTYLAERDRLPYVRGRVDFTQQSRRPWQTRLDCEYEEHTSDIEDNRLLAWGLRCALATNLCHAAVVPSVRKAFRTVRSLASLQRFPASSCTGRLYNRLNDDYEPLHALCRFFIEHTGPTHHEGDRATLPFLIEMAELFERFVAEWLRTHLSDKLRLRYQHPLKIGTSGILSGRIDIVIERDDGLPLWVLDTKYKVPNKPAMDDLYQVVAYAEAIGANRAALIYPRALPTSVAERWGKSDISVRTATFDLSGDLEEAGEILLRDLQLI